MSGTLNIAGKFPNAHILALYQRLNETARQLDSWPEMLLLLAVLKARNLQDLSPAGRQALYVKVVSNGSQSTSETHYDAGVNPAFGDTFTIPIQQGQQNMQVEVWARQGGSDVMLGGSFVSLPNLTAANGAVIRVQLSDQSGQPRGEVDCTGTVTWATSSTDPSAPPKPPSPSQL